MEVDSRNCSTCPYRIECYELFRKQEKELEKLKQRCKIDWYKIDTSTSSLTCPVCG